MIEVMACWGSYRPACRLIQILVRLRRQLPKHHDKAIATFGSVSHDSRSRPEVQDNPSLSSTIQTPLTPLSYQSLALQPFQVKPADFAAQADMFDDELNIWDYLFEQSSRVKSPTTQAYNLTCSWKPEQPRLQQQQNSVLLNSIIFRQGMKENCYLVKHPNLFYTSRVDYHTNKSTIPIKSTNGHLL